MQESHSDDGRGGGKMCRFGSTPAIAGVGPGAKEQVSISSHAGISKDADWTPSSNTLQHQ